MRYGSVCSGVEAATQAWHPLGWEPEFFSEIEKFPSAVLAHHYPHVPNLGDMTKFKDWKHGPIDLLVGGTPCQSFSVAGLRKGLDDPRGNLMLTYLAIAGRNRPKWIVWENVPGVLSSNEGRDFGTFLTGLGQLGYGFGFRVLDAQYIRVDGLEWAVPQRRRRVFVVGYLGDWRRAAAVLFDAESLRGNTAPSRKTGQGVAGHAARSVAIRGRDGTPQVELGEDVANAILTPNGGRGGIGCGAVFTKQSLGEYSDLDIASTDSARDFKDATDLVAHVPDVAGTMKSCAQSGGFSNSADHAAAGYMIPVTHSLRGEGYDASEDGTGRGTPIVPVSFQGNASGANMHFDQDTCATLKSGHSNHPAVFHGIHTTGHQGDRAYDPSGAWGTLAAQGGNNCGGAGGLLVQPWAVRRLMPVECERLQGFPDGFTEIP